MSVASSAQVVEIFLTVFNIAHPSAIICSIQVCPFLRTPRKGDRLRILAKSCRKIANLKESNVNASAKRRKPLIRRVQRNLSSLETRRLSKFETDLRVFVLFVGAGCERGRSETRSTPQFETPLIRRFGRRSKEPWRRDKSGAGALQMCLSGTLKNIESCFQCTVKSTLRTLVGVDLFS